MTERSSSISDSSRNTSGDGSAVNALGISTKDVAAVAVIVAVAVVV